MRLTDLLRVTRPPSSTTLLALAALTYGGVLGACAQGIGGTTGTPTTMGDDSATGDDDDQGTGDDENVNPDSGAFGGSDATADAGDDDDDASPGREAGAEAGSGADAGDAGTKADASDAASDGGGGSTAPTCPDMTSGTLIIVEIMIASKSGNYGSDTGEWVELLNPSSTCAVQLSGFTVTSPRGSGADTAVLDDGYKVGPGETVLVADSTAPGQNNGLTGQVYAFGNSDVLANGGDTVSVLHGSTTLDTFTYTSDSVTVVDGQSLEYPSDCSVKNGGNLSYWKPSTTDYGTTMTCGTTASTACMGTPNAANLDVIPTVGCE